MNYYFITVLMVHLMSTNLGAMDVPDAPPSKRRKLDENSSAPVSTSIKSLVPSRVPQLKNLAARVVALHEAGQQHIITDIEGAIMRRPSGEPLFEGLGAIDQEVHDQIINAKRENIQSCLKDAFIISSDADPAKVIDFSDENLKKVFFLPDGKLLVENKTRVYDILMGSVFITRILDLSTQSQIVLRAGGHSIHAMSSKFKKIIYENASEPWLIRDVESKQPEIVVEFPAQSNHRICLFDDANQCYGISYKLENVGCCNVYSLIQDEEFNRLKPRLVWSHSLEGRLCKLIELKYPHVIYDSDNPEYKQNDQTVNAVPLNDFSMVNIDSKKIESFNDPRIMGLYHEWFKANYADQYTGQKSIQPIDVALLKKKLRILIVATLKSGDSRFFIAMPQEQTIIPIEHRMGNGIKIKSLKLSSSAKALYLKETEGSGVQTVAIFNAINGKCIGRIATQNNGYRVLINKDSSLLAAYKKYDTNINIHVLAQPDLLNSEDVFMAHQLKEDPEHLRSLVAECNAVDRGFIRTDQEEGGDTQPLDPNDDWQGPVDDLNLADAEFEDNYASDDDQVLDALFGQLDDE